MSASNDEVSKYFRIRRTLLEMLKDRGYAVSDWEIQLTKKQFIKKFGERVSKEDLHMCKTNEAGEQIFVLFPKDEKVGVKTIKEVEESLKISKASRAIIVLEKNLSPMARRVVQTARQIKIEIFQLPRMQEGDSISRYFGLRRGQVVKIIRPSETAGRYVTYRYVI